MAPLDGISSHSGDKNRLHIALCGPLLNTLLAGVEFFFFFGGKNLPTHKMSNIPTKRENGVLKIKVFFFVHLSTTLYFWTGTRMDRGVLVPLVIKYRRYSVFIFE